MRSASSSRSGRSARVTTCEVTAPRQTSVGQVDVEVTASDGTATIVGIWLGEHHTHSGTRTGRFTSLTESLTDLVVAGLQR